MRYTKLFDELKTIAHPFAIDRVVAHMAKIVEHELPAQSVDVFFQPPQAKEIVCWHRKSHGKAYDNSHAAALAAFHRGQNRNSGNLFAYTLRARAIPFGVITAHLTKDHVSVDERLLMLIDYYALLLYSEKLSFLANRDRLTHLYNRGYLFQTLERWAETGDISIIMMDIDHFKHYNDRYGHQTGDMVLRKLAVTLRREFRDALIGRYGGEEFLLAFKNGNESQVAAVMERIRSLVAMTDFSTKDYSLRITLSLGGSIYRHVRDDINDCIGRADKALYESKHAGRNRAMMAHEASA